MSPKFAFSRVLEPQCSNYKLFQLGPSRRANFTPYGYPTNTISPRTSYYSPPTAHATLLSNYNQLNEWPLQFLRTGLYGRSYGYLYVRTTDGDWWSSTASSATNGRYLRTWTGNVNAQDSYFRGSGFALRGVANIVQIKKT